MISKSEMKTYFIRANCHALRKCFKHDFHETTYFKPTFCIHCTGLVRFVDFYIPKTCLCLFASSSSSKGCLSFFDCCHFVMLVS